jgi:uncharacterized protein YyaL (SSP411 family)
MSGSFRSPQFLVLTNLLLAIAVLAVGLRYSNRFLPEEQPNRLAKETSPFLSRAAKEKVDWHAFGETPFAIAQSSRRLIFLEAGTIFSRASNSLRLRFYTDEEFVRLLNSHFVCVRADLNESPAIAPALDLNSMGIATSGGMVVAVLTPDGAIVAISPYRRLRSDREPLGMYEWLSELARRHSVDAEGLRLEAESLHSDRADVIKSQRVPGQLDRASALALASAAMRSLDRRTGAISRVTAPAAPALPRLLRVTAPRDAATFLEALTSSPVFDSVEAGFFESYGDRNWVLPEYGKRTGRSALLAAECAALSGSSPNLKEVARRTAEWVLAQRDADTGLFTAGAGTDEEVLGGSAFYDMTAEQITGAGFRLAPGAARGLPVATPSARPAALLEIRSGRAPPDTEAGVYADVNGMVLAGLYSMSLSLNDRTLANRADAIFARLVSSFVLPLGDVRHALTGRADSTAYAGSYAWVARAAIERFRATSAADALEVAERVMKRLSELFAADDGSILTSLGSEYAYARFVLRIAETADTPDESINALVARNCIDLAVMTGKAEYRVAAERILSASAGSLPKLGLGAVGMTAAIAEYYQPAILVKSADPASFVGSLMLEAPQCSIAPLLRDSPPGYYWVTSAQVDGPLSLTEVQARAAALFPSP